MPPLMTQLPVCALAKFDASSTTPPAARPAESLIRAILNLRAIVDASSDCALLSIHWRVQGNWRRLRSGWRGKPVANARIDRMPRAGNLGPKEPEPPQ